MFTLRLLKLKIHSRRVSVFKRLLPIFAFLLASVMIIWPALVEQKDKFASLTPSQQSIKNSNTDMESVRFFSRDNNQNPITVIAQTVKEADTSRQIISLDKPQAQYVMSDGIVLQGNTSYGLAFQKDKYLYFEEQVNATTDNGYQAFSEKVVCDYNAGTIGSEQDVFVKGPAGMIKANGFYISDRGNYLHFKGFTDTLLFHQEKIKDEISALDFSHQKSYLNENDKNVFITSENGIIINQSDKTMTALKNVNIQQNNNLLEAQKVVLYYTKNEYGKTIIQKVTAQDNVVAVQGTQRVSGQNMTIYKDKDDIMTILQELPEQIILDKKDKIGQLIVITDNAMVTEGINTVKANRIYALYDDKGQILTKVIAFGKMNATNGQQKIIGEYGIYSPKTKIISVYEKVSLHEKESVLKGEYATLNLKTGISSLNASKNKKTKGRVKGQIIPNNFEMKKKSEAK
ncbi:MAG: LPS export ABC transporter periplasmic protein LptC [Alphaproteobacteria bacterium]|nr:LPS export ABC transporter periplasmic protein LptC [Alphaproteobacteria bacterium]